MNVGSLFAGIGGFDLGFERAGMRTLWQVELSEFRRKVLAQHFPLAKRYEDVRDVGAHNLAQVDVICGGFPCQDISLAGRGEGIDGARSGLWAEFARIIRELEPRWVVVENVPALTSRGLDRVLRDLAKSGYDAEWDCLPAKAAYAPHIRDRIWIVAYPNANGGGWQGSEESDRQQERPRERTSQRDDADGFRDLVADTDEGRRLQGLCEPTRPDKWQGPGDPEWCSELQDPDSSALQPWRVGGRAAQASSAGWWSAEPPIQRVAHGLPDRLDRCAALGDALVPQIAEWIGGRLMAYAHHLDDDLPHHKNTGVLLKAEAGTAEANNQNQPPVRERGSLSG